MRTSNDPFGNQMFINMEMGLFCNIFLSLFSGSFYIEEEKDKLLKLRNSIAIVCQKDEAQQEQNLQNYQKIID